MIVMLSNGRLLDLCRKLEAPSCIRAGWMQCMTDRVIGMNSTLGQHQADALCVN